MKVVITTDYGFHISREGWLWLLAHGFDPHKVYKSPHFPDEFKMDNSWFLDENQRELYREDINTFYTSCDPPYHNDLPDDWWFREFPTFDHYVKYGGCMYSIEMDRHDPLLVQMVEELGSLANPYDRYTDPPTRTDRGLKIVEIPDGTEYRIVDPDGGGTEYIEQLNVKRWS